MRSILLVIPLVFITVGLFAQADSSGFYLQKALDEKAKSHKLLAIRSLEKAETFNKLNPQVIAELAAAYLEVRMLAKAREKFLQLESLGAATTATYRQLMELTFNMRQFPDAIKYAGLIKKIEASGKVDYILGRSYFETDDLANAIPLLTAAAKADTANAEIPHLLATAYTNMQNFKQAIPFFHKAVAIDPKNPRLVYEMALVYYGAGDEKTALKYLLEAGEKGYKKDAEYMQNLSTALMNAGRLGEGLEMMKQTLAKRPTDIGLMDTMAEACYDAGKYDDAIGFYNKILEINDKKADALYMMGMAYQKKGQVENGRVLCDKAIAMDPNLRNLKQAKPMPGGL